MSRYVISCQIDREMDLDFLNCCISPLSHYENQIVTSIPRVLSVSILSGHTVSSTCTYYGESSDSYTQMTAPLHTVHAVVPASAQSTHLQRTRPCFHSLSHMPTQAVANPPKPLSLLRRPADSGSRRQIDREIGS